MKRVNILLRVSSQQQLHDDDIPVQRSECMDFIGKHNDWAFQREYVEKAVSGFKTSVKDREILQEILEDARQKTFDVLVVYMSDRIGRKEDESPVFVSTLNNLGIEIWTVREGQLKTDQHIDKLLNYIRFWQAEGESRKTGARVRDAQETFARAGKFIGGYAPLGYRLVPSGETSSHGRLLKKLAMDAEKAPIIREIFDYAVNYNYGALKIAKVLNEKGIPAPNTTWKACTVAEILKNPVYMGYIAYNRRQHSKCGGNFERMPMEDWILSGEQNPELVIIPKETWYRAQAMRENRKAGIKRGRDTGNGKYPASSSGRLVLMGLAYCGYCGCRLTNGSKYDYWTTKDGEKRKKFVGRYRCTNMANGSLECQGKAYYRSEEIEPIIYSVVTSYLDSLRESDTHDDLMRLQEEQRARLEKEKNSLVKALKSAQDDIATLQENIPAALRGESAFSVERLSSMIQGKEEKIVGLQKQIAARDREYQDTQLKRKDLKNMGSLISNWGELFMKCSIPEQKVMLSKLIERIDIKENDIRIKFRISMEEFGGNQQGISSDPPTTP
ncbi:MAG: recombinase family protein [Blautia sp.]|nr:recombinase family protein [Blautia sp.]